MITENGMGYHNMKVKISQCPACKSKARNLWILRYPDYTVIECEDCGHKVKSENLQTAIKLWSGNMKKIIAIEIKDMK